MGILETLAVAFVRTFGITQPSDAQRRQAAWFILALLVLTVALVAGVGYAFYAALHR